MKTEHQGVGSYDYECKSPDCFYCERLKIKILEAKISKHMNKSPPSFKVTLPTLIIDDP